MFEKSETPLGNKKKFRQTAVHTEKLREQTRRTTNDHCRKKVATKKKEKIVNFFV